MKNSLIIPFALLAVAVVVLGLSLKAGIDRFSDRDRVVTVRGLCEKEVKANKVTWPIVTKEMGDDLASIYNRIENTNKVIVEFLRNGGIDEGDIAVNPPQVYDNAANRYGSDRPAFRYLVTNVIVVTSSKIDKVRELMKNQTALMRAGVAVVAGDYQYSTTYEYTELNTVKPEMIAEATANAREAADKFAADSHSKLGKIKTASQGQFSISDRDQYTPDIKTVRVVTYITYYLED